MAAIVKPILLVHQTTKRCVECGTDIQIGEESMCALVGIEAGSFLSSTFISWCDFCWGMVPGSGESSE